MGPRACARGLGSGLRLRWYWGAPPSHLPRPLLPLLPPLHPTAPPELEASHLSAARREKVKAVS